jgi:hypothetical protein
MLGRGHRTAADIREGAVSYITDVLLITSSSDGEAVATVNAWLAENADGQQLAPAELNGGGGFKVTSNAVYAAAFNYLDRCDLEDAIRAAPWHIPSDVVAYFDDESGETFVMSPAREGRWMLREADHRGY